ncbi:hypothetical protein PENTCL1PPCAC_7194 [Pristionchus entomophagus]|uniref:Uncharacterized protein n=1 Tax=Pristionchus entomophagus TaxID=358040 RepID=A0AAV5SUH0_9BILA|nr:hypothetical protein PENTCL1PPCAC_7194 [Pristionchus entomophagus]
MSDTVEEHKTLADLNLEKFDIVEEILAEWEPKEKVEGGLFCSVDELFMLVNAKSDVLFSSVPSLRSFLSSRPHLFHLTKNDTVRVRLREDRRRYIQVVRFVVDEVSPVSLQSMIERLWKDEMEKMKEKKEMDQNEKNRGIMEEDDEETRRRKMLAAGPWRITSVWKSIKRGGEGVFRVDGDTISLTEDALAEESFFDDLYLDYNEQVVKKLEENLAQAQAQAPVQDDKKDERVARKQRQSNSTQFTLLGLAREVKPKYIKSLCVSPNFESETIYILPNQLGDVKTKYHYGQMLMIRAHDVIGDPEHLKNRFRADEMRAFPMTAMSDHMLPKAALTTGWEDMRVRKRPLFLKQTEGDEGIDEGEDQMTELTRLIKKHGNQLATANRQMTETFSDYILPTKKIQDAFNDRCVYERIVVKEMDNLIACGIKKRKEHGETEGGRDGASDSYPLGDLLKDLQNRSINSPDVIPIIDELTLEELYNGISSRPHLYRINEAASCVSFITRERIDRLLSWLDTRSLWTMQSLRETLGQGKAGEDWRDDPVEDLVRELEPIVVRNGAVFSVGMKRTKDGLWMKVNGVMRRGTTTGGIRKVKRKNEMKEEEEDYYEEEMEEEERRKEEYYGPTLKEGRGNEDGEVDYIMNWNEENEEDREEENRRSEEAVEKGKTKGRGGFGPRFMSPIDNIYDE